MLANNRNTLCAALATVTLAATTTLAQTSDATPPPAWRSRVVNPVTETGAVKDPLPAALHAATAEPTPPEAAPHGVDAPATLVPRVTPAATAQTIPRPPVTEAGWQARLKWIRHPLVALSIVLLVMGGALLIVKRWLPQKLPTGVDAIRVLARLSLSPRQSVLLLHVGRQVVMVGLSGDRMQRLHVIDHPDEAAMLLGSAAKAERRRTAKSRFATSLGREQERFAAAEPGLQGSKAASHVASASAPEIDEAIVPADDASLREARGRLQDVLSSLRELQSR